MEKIGERLKRLRNKVGLKQGEFARRVSISQGMLSGIENGNEILSDRNMKLICLEFGVNLDWLQHGGDEPIFKSQELTSGEKELLEIYDKLIPETQKEVRDYANEKLELQELREKTVGRDALKQAPGGTTSPLEAPQEGERQESIG
ncbi:MAG: helix-turn-helix domain-containing protein [Treponema sp.]|jgi:transcriptional regulator with XRE-family HTH domain|nr:helix-turn-helix domain-containing protein [Treponema sp.]